MNLNETLALVKAAQAKPGDPSSIAKSITTGTGLVWYDLQAPAKNLYPVLTPLRNRMPRVGGNGGVATNWRVVSAISGSGYDASPWVPEGQRSARMSYTTGTLAANYSTIGEEDQISYEAISASQNFEDLRASMVMRLLQKAMIKEEDAILGGNLSVALGTPTAPTVTAASDGTINDGTYLVAVVALTYEGMKNSSVSGGIATAQTVTGADGLTFTLNGGSSNKSSTTSTGALSTTNVNSISASTPAVVGACGYAWFVGTSGNEKLQAITTINSIKMLTLSTTHQALSAITADKSKNSLAFDGLLYSAFASGSNAYVASLATGTAGTGTQMTTNSSGGITEIDVMLKNMWDTYRVSPTAIFVNSQELKSIYKLILSNGSSPLLRYNTDGRDPYAFVASGTIEAYFNPYAVNGGYKVPILLHPTLPAGTILAYCENLPAQYQNNNVPNVAEVHTRRDWYQIDWPLKTRQQEVGVYAEEVLAVYAPFSIGIINNIAAS